MFLKSFIGIVSAIATVAAALAAWRSVRQVEETRKDEFLPIIKIKIALPNSSNVPDQEMRETVIFLNVGKGIAENVCVFMKNVQRTKYYTVMPGEEVPAKNGFVYKYSELSEEQIPIVVKYKDVYGRKFSTTTTILKNKEDNWYHNRESDWQFHH